MPSPTLPNSKDEARPTSLRAPIALALLVLGGALFFAGWLVAYRDVTDMKATLATRSGEFEAQMAAMSARLEQAEQEDASDDARRVLLEARRQIAIAALALEDENYGVARTHLDEGRRAMVQGGVHEFEDAQIDSSDADFSRAELRRIAEAIDEVIQQS